MNKIAASLGYGHVVTQNCLWFLMIVV